MYGGMFSGMIDDEEDEQEIPVIYPKFSLSPNIEYLVLSDGSRWVRENGTDKDEWVKIPDGAPCLTGEPWE